MNIIDTQGIWIDEPAANLVADFNQAMGNEISPRQIAAEDLDTELAKFLFSLIDEEFNETRAAFQARDLLGVIDGLQDLKYVIYGFELRLGIASEEHFAEVHAANMRKLGPDGEPLRREDGKVIKPEGWEGPDHQAVLDDVAERSTLYA